MTWDDDDPVRVSVTRRRFTRDDLAKVDFSTYLASEESSLSSDEEEDEEASDGSAAADADGNAKDAAESADARSTRLARLKARRKAQRAKYKALLSEVGATTVRVAAARRAAATAEDTSCTRGR